MLILRNKQNGIIVSTLEEKCESVLEVPYLKALFTASPNTGFISDADYIENEKKIMITVIAPEIIEDIKVKYLLQEAMSKKEEWEEIPVLI